MNVTEAGMLSINVLGKLSGRDLEDALWHIGLNLHQYSLSDRTTFIEYIRNNIDKIPPATLFRCIGYLMPTYFSCMTKIEKQLYLNILIDLEIDCHTTNLSDLFDMIGILFKVAPNSSRDGLLSIIFRNSDCTGDPSTIISLCNAFRFIFLEVDLSARLTILEILESIRKANQFDFLTGSIVHTIESLSVLLES